MPSSRRMKVTGLAIVLVIGILYYTTNGASDTYNSPFYTRTVEAINQRQNSEAREQVMLEEKQRNERVERLEREHNAAISAAAAATKTTQLPGAGAGAGSEKQKPIVEDAAAPAQQSEKSVAGRKTMKDGKVVEGKPGEHDDGVAKVGNVAPKSSHTATAEETAEEHKIEMALNEILKKGPIIVFSKSYCPFSKNAKHILLDLYTISPPPYVVELDQHELGQGLQNALQKSTGRRTVPNVLINGKSIGGGDDIEALHNEGKIIDTVNSMGGKRIMKIEKKHEDEKRSEIKFKA